MSTGSTGAGWSWPFEIGQRVRYIGPNPSFRRTIEGRVVSVTRNFDDFSADVEWASGTHGATTARYVSTFPIADLEAVPDLPTPPKFETTDEADAWLEAHGVH